MGKIKIFVAEHCGPCGEIKKLATEGRIELEGEEGEESEVSVVDIETEEGFAQIPTNLDGVPAAIDESGKICRLGIDRENNILVIGCGEPNGENKGT